MGRCKNWSIGFNRWPMDRRFSYLNTTRSSLVQPEEDWNCASNPYVQRNNLSHRSGRDVLGFSRPADLLRSKRRVDSRRSETIGLFHRPDFQSRWFESKWTSIFSFSDEISVAMCGLGILRPTDERVDRRDRSDSSRSSRSTCLPKSVRRSVEPVEILRRTSSAHVWGKGFANSLSSCRRDPSRSRHRHPRGERLRLRQRIYRSDERLSIQRTFVARRRRRVEQTSRMETETLRRRFRRKKRIRTAEIRWNGTTV